MARTVGTLALLVLAACRGDLADVRAADLAAAHAAFLANLSAIHARDAERYLAGYVSSQDFVALSPNGLVRGFTPLAQARRLSQSWPDTLVAGDPELLWLGPGVVWGAYEYLAVQDGETARGWSERIFVETADGWKITMTGVMPAGPVVP